MSGKYSTQRSWRLAGVATSHGVSPKESCGSGSYWHSIWPCMTLGSPGRRWRGNIPRSALGWLSQNTRSTDKECTACQSIGEARSLATLMSKAQPVGIRQAGVFVPCLTCPGISRFPTFRLPGTGGWRLAVSPSCRIGMARRGSEQFRRLFLVKGADCEPRR